MPTCLHRFALLPLAAFALLESSANAQETATSVGNASATSDGSSEQETPTGEASEPWLLTFDVAAVLPITEPQSSLFSFGFAADVGVHRGITSWFVPGIHLRAGGVLDGDAPEDFGAEDPEGAYLIGISGLLRFRAGESPQRGTGFWIEAGGGGLLTGGKPRASVEGALGYGFEVGKLDLAPFVRYQQIIDDSNAVTTEDARLLMFGLELSLFDARHVPYVPPPPPGDTDGDGLLDPVDNCPTQPEDFDGFRDEDGCPEPDNDEDGIADGQDACPIVPEDIDQFQDEDGCPEPDNDGDGILDPQDNCPNEREVINGIDDQDGCPDQGEIEMIDDRIVLEEQVLFEYDRSRIRTSARPVLNAIVNLAQQHPEWVQLRVEGHADVRGDAEYNLQLSRRRALAVREALVALGIPGETIEAEGFGATRLRDPGTTPEAHQRNRRVEFVVVARRVDPERLPEQQNPRSTTPKSSGGGTP